MRTRNITVNFEAVWNALDDKRRAQRRSWASLAAELETSDMQLSGMKWQGTGVNAHLLAAMMIYLGRDLRDFLRTKEAA